MTTWNSRGLRGAGLEELINRTNEKYLEKGLALIQKIPTPITPINIDQTSRHITILVPFRGSLSVLMPKNVLWIHSVFRISMNIR